MTSSANWDSGSLDPKSDAYGQEATQTPFETEGGVSKSGVKDRAADAAATAKDEGAHVADTAKDEVQKVAGEAKEKAADLLGDAKAQIGDQSKTQLQYLVTKLEDLTSEIDSMVDGSDVQGTVTDLARQFSDKTRALSSHLSGREPQDLLDDVRSFARQRPGAFLVGAVAAGVLAGRLTRGVKQANDSAPSSPNPTSPSASTGSLAAGGLGGTTSSIPSGQGTGTGEWP